MCSYRNENIVLAKGCSFMIDFKPGELFFIDVQVVKSMRNFGDIITCEIGVVLHGKPNIFNFTFSDLSCICFHWSILSLFSSVLCF